MPASAAAGVGDARRDYRCRRIPRVAPHRPVPGRWPRGHRLRQFPHRSRGKPGASCPEPELRVRRARRVSAVRGGRRPRRRAALCVARESARLSAVSAGDTEGRLGRHQQFARSCARQRAPGSFSLRPPRCTAIRRCIRSRRPTGATSIRSASGACTTRRNASPRRPPWRTTATMASIPGSCASSIPTDRACARTTAGWYPTSSCRRWAGRR